MRWGWVAVELCQLVLTLWVNVGIWPVEAPLVSAPCGLAIEAAREGQMHVCHFVLAATQFIEVEMQTC